MRTSNAFDLPPTTLAADRETIERRPAAPTSLPEVTQAKLEAADARAAASEDKHRKAAANHATALQVRDEAKAVYDDRLDTETQAANAALDGQVGAAARVNKCSAATGEAADGLARAERQLEIASRVLAGATADRGAAVSARHDAYLAHVLAESDAAVYQAELEALRLAKLVRAELGPLMQNVRTAWAVVLAEFGELGREVQSRVSATPRASSWSWSARRLTVKVPS